MDSSFIHSFIHSSDSPSCQNASEEQGRGFPEHSSPGSSLVTPTLCDSRQVAAPLLVSVPSACRLLGDDAPSGVGRSLPTAGAQEMLVECMSLPPLPPTPPYLFTTPPLTSISGETIPCAWAGKLGAGQVPGSGWSCHPRHGTRGQWAPPISPHSPSSGRPCPTVLKAEELIPLPPGWFLPLH